MLFLSTDGQFSHLSEYNCEDLTVVAHFFLPDECLFQRNKMGKEGYMMENDEIRAKPRRNMEDLKAFRSTGTCT